MSDSQFPSRPETRLLPSMPLVNAMAAHFEGLGRDPQVPWAQWDGSGLQSATRPYPPSPKPH